MTEIKDLETAVPAPQAWLDELKRRLQWHDRRKVYSALLATLHALRDSLPQNAAIYLGAQLPVAEAAVD